MDLLEDLKMSLLNFNFVMIYIIHKMLVLLKNYLNNLKDSILEFFFKEYFYFLKKLLFFSQHIIMEDIRNLFRLKRELNYTAIKDIEILSD